jgi:carbamoyl-phosphate synthase large subunit
MILGGGPNRIGQGIEFDYCCVHAAFALKEDGFRNHHGQFQSGNRFDRLRHQRQAVFRAADAGGRAAHLRAGKMLGRHRPVRRPDAAEPRAGSLQKNGVNIIGTSPQSIEIAEDRKLFAAMLEQAEHSAAAERPRDQRGRGARGRQALGYPVLVRPSFVLGGRAMQIVYSDAELSHYMRFAVEASPERPVLVDKFLEDATEVDVDCIADVGRFSNPDEGTIVIGGMLEHIEFAGVHSGDAAMVLPPHTLSQQRDRNHPQYTHAMARELKVIGLMNVQYAVKGETVYVLEVNPRASRTVPFVSKAIGVPLAKLAAKVMAGKTLKELGFTGKSGRSTGRSRNPSSPSTVFTARTFCSRPKCVRPAKSWAWTPISEWPTPNRRWPPTRHCR